MNELDVDVSIWDIFVNKQKIIGLNTIEFNDFSWMSTSLLCSKAYQITNAKAYVFSDSLHRVGKMDPIATWKSKN